MTFLTARLGRGAQDGFGRPQPFLEGAQDGFGRPEPIPVGARDGFGAFLFGARDGFLVTFGSFMSGSCVSFTWSI